MLIGFSVGNAAGTVIVRATVAMLLCWGIGCAVGSIAQAALDRQLELYKEQHPLPLLSVEAGGEDGGSEGVTEQATPEGTVGAGQPGNDDGTSGPR